MKVTLVYYQLLKLLIHISVNHSSMLCFLCVRMRMTDMRRGRSGRDRERERVETKVAPGDEEIKFHLTLKHLLYKTNYFSKESFHFCMAVGLRAIT